MKCPNCSTENSEDSLFCNKCGNNLSQKNEKSEQQVDNEKSKNKSKKALVTIVSSALLILCGFVIFLVMNNPMNQFEKNIKMNNYAEAAEIYNKELKGNTDKEKAVNEFLENEIAEIKNAFMDNRIEYNVAKDKLKTIENTKLASSEVKAVLYHINKMNDSRIAFKKADEFLKNNDLVNAIKEFKKVIKEDKNYEQAQEQITNNEKNYKEQLLRSVDELVNNNNYNDALELLKEALTIIENDADLLAKKSIYEKAQEEKLASERKQKMEELKGKQELEVVSTKIVPDYFEIDDQAQVIVKNNTQKVVKYFDVGILMYDRNGYPVKSGTLAGGSLLFKGKAESVNIQPGQTFGNSSAWDLYTNYGTVSKIIVCVRSVEYYDGSTWTNDYYNYWEEEYLGKPIK